MRESGQGKNDRELEMDSQTKEIFIPMIVFVDRRWSEKHIVQTVETDKFCEESEGNLHSVGMLLTTCFSSVRLPINTSKE